MVSAGKAAGMRPGDLVGAITGEAGLTARQIGAIRIVTDHSLVEVPQTLAGRVITALERTTIRGKRVSVRRETGPPDRRTSPAPRLRKPAHKAHK